MFEGKFEHTEDKPTVEVLDPKNLEKKFPTLTTEQYKEYLRNFVENIFIRDNFIGEGKTADVFKHPNADINLCFKHVHSQLPGNIEVEDEVVFLTDLQNVHPDVRVPKPLATISFPLRHVEVDGVKKAVKDKVLVMETIQGGTIDDIVKKKVPLPPNFNKETFFAQLSSFMKTIHEKGAYHRDLHTGNVMVDEETAKPVVIDFGKSCWEYSQSEDPYRIFSNENTHLTTYLNDEKAFNDVKNEFSVYLDSLK